MRLEGGRPGDGDSPCVEVVPNPEDSPSRALGESPTVRLVFFYYFFLFWRNTSKLEEWPHISNADRYLGSSGTMRVVGPGLDDRDLFLSLRLDLIWLIII